MSRPHHHRMSGRGQSLAPRICRACVPGGGYTPAGEGADDESFTIFFFPLSTTDSPPRFAGTCACENRRELSQNTAPSRSLAFHLPLPSPLSPLPLLLRFGVIPHKCSNAPPKLHKFVCLAHPLFCQLDEPIKNSPLRTPQRPALLTIFALDCCHFNASQCGELPRGAFS